MAFASISGELLFPAPPLRKSGRILIFMHLRRKITEMFHVDAGETTFLWLLLSLVVVTWWMCTDFCWFSVGSFGLRYKPKLWHPNVASNKISGARQLPLLQ